MDFYSLRTRKRKNGMIAVYPDYRVGRSNDLMVRGKSFYAVWDEEKGLWSRDEYDVARFVDADILKTVEELRENTDDDTPVVGELLSDFSSGHWMKFQSFLKNVGDCSIDLDSSLVFANTPTSRATYASRRLPYALEAGDISAYDELMATLYEPDERTKIEWCIGSIVEGASKDIQKFIVLYGSAGAGKSTVLNIVQQLFAGYCTTFDAKALGSSQNAFATEVFRTNPLVAIQHDGDLSRIEDNTKLNSIISHEEMIMNEKYKASYSARANAFLWMATNRPVKITDAKSGIIRRLIDVTPSGRRLPAEQYMAIQRRIPEELGAIAHHCREVFRSMGAHYYDPYRPTEMILKTDVFYNFVEDVQFDIQDGVSLQRAYDLYKKYCDEALVEYRMPKYRFREELKNYFREFHERYRDGDERVRNYYTGFRDDKFNGREKTPELAKEKYWLSLDEEKGALDDILADRPAQYAGEDGNPTTRWDDVGTTLRELDPHRLHFVRPPLDHVVIDLDIRGENGEKDRALNLEAASRFPPTYAEFSKSGAGIHLHYVYSGDISELSPEYSEGIEIKTFRGRASLRRMLNGCNSMPVATLSSGSLPRKEKKQVLDQAQVKSERALRELIIRNLRKEIHPATKPSMDFIEKILNDAYNSDLSYDVSDMRGKIMWFAMRSTNQKEECLKILMRLKMRSKDVEKGEYASKPIENTSTDDIVFFDIEVYPNLLLVCWMVDRDGAEVVPMVNPSKEEIERLLQKKLVGFNNRKYDNHVIYARYLGESVASCYRLSQRLVHNDRNATFIEAYNLSYTDVYDFSTKKQSLKAWEIELGLPHKEMDHPWDEPVPDDILQNVIEYCANDVRATREVFHHLEADWEARQVLAKVAGLTVNHTTNQCTQQIIFGNDRRPAFHHRDLSLDFPGYEFSYGKSSYRGEDPGEGGYVHAKPGIYSNVALLDIASMHPHSLIAMNVFGDTYTARFKAIVDARIAIKHGDMAAAGKALDGALKPFLEGDLKALAYSLKIAINSVYGLTSARFPTRCNGMDPANNPDNIVAKRGALFMIDLKHAVEERGGIVVHIKTDSIKIAEATPEIIEFVNEYGRKWGYTFEHETTYDRMCLVNRAVYLAHDKTGWHATGAQFQQPYVFNHLCEGRPDRLEDFVEKKQVVKGTLYIDHGTEEAPDRRFVGRVGEFIPVNEEGGGGALVVKRDEKFVSASGAKGYLWEERAVVERYADESDRDPMSFVDRKYAEKLLDDAYAAISKYGDAEEFINGNGKEATCADTDSGTSSETPS